LVARLVGAGPGAGGFVTTLHAAGGHGHGQLHFAGGGAFEEAGSGEAEQERAAEEDFGPAAGEAFYVGEKLVNVFVLKLGGEVLDFVGRLLGVLGHGGLLPFLHLLAGLAKGLGDAAEAFGGAAFLAAEHGFGFLLGDVDGFIHFVLGFVHQLTGLLPDRLGGFGSTTWLLPGALSSCAGH
jgi:hypothetical protein